MTPKDVLVALSLIAAAISIYFAFDSWRTARRLDKWRYLNDRLTRAEALIKRMAAEGKSAYTDDAGYHKWLERVGFIINDAMAYMEDKR